MNLKKQINDLEDLKVENCEKINQLESHVDHLKEEVNVKTKEIEQIKSKYELVNNLF